MLEFEVEERFLHSGAAKSAVPPVGMTDVGSWTILRKSNFAQVAFPG
jgi:hypothetical protein